MKAVFFDLVGTLVRPRESIGNQYAAVARRHGAEVDPGTLEAAFAREMASTPPARLSGLSPEAAGAMERDWWRGFVTRVFDGALTRPGRFDPFFDDLYRHFTTSAAWQLYEDVEPALERLRAAGLTTGLITNYDSRIHALLESLGLTSRLDSVTIPATAGVQKPDPRIFAHALRKHGLAPADTGYIGDSVADDYRGALDAGMAAVLLDRDGEHACLAGVARAPTLEEAIGLLLRR